MPKPFFSISEPVRYEGPDSKNPLAFRWYDADRKVLGKSMKEHLRFTVCYWHSLCGTGSDPFGGPSIERPWFGAGDPMAQAKAKADVGFEMFRLLNAPFFAWHDRDIAPEGATLKESNANVSAIAEVFQKKMAETKVECLWGTANMFSHRRFIAGAATNPDPDVFAWSAAQVKHALETTKQLNGAGYVLWGGREGYETLLNTNLKRELAQAGRFLQMVVEHKHKIGFKGLILIEPKPREPSKHQYDYDVATVYGFLKANGLENEVKVNIEQNHAILAGHTFEHEIALAAALGLFGSIDINRGDDQLGWDTDQFGMNVPQLTLALLEILKAGGFTGGGLNFDAKVRRQSLDPDDLLYAHIGGMDACAQALLAAARIIEDGTIGKAVADRYASWDKPAAQAMLAKGATLESVAARVEKEGLDPQPKSGRQEWMEGVLNRLI
jgi:xylose isomerase